MDDLGNVSCSEHFDQVFSLTPSPQASGRREVVEDSIYTVLSQTGRKIYRLPFLALVELLCHVLFGVTVCFMWGILTLVCFDRRFVSGVIFHTRA